MAQAKVLNEKEIRKVLLYIASKKHSARNRCMFLMTTNCGMRAGAHLAVYWSIYFLSPRTPFNFLPVRPPPYPHPQNAQDGSIPTLYTLFCSGDCLKSEIELMQIRICLFLGGFNDEVQR
jgi:hypothetical protein